VIFGTDSAWQTSLYDGVLPETLVILLKA